MDNPPPFILRLYQPTDFNAVLAVMQAAVLADDLPQPATAEALRARVSTLADNPRLNPADDRWVIAAPAAGVVAYADGWLTGAGGAGHYHTECFVRPDQRGRGLGRALLRRQCQRAQAIARRLAPLATPVTVTLVARAWERQAAARAVLVARGLQPARTFVELARDLSEPVPAVMAPPGLRLEPWIDRRADEALWQAYDEALADHWGYTGESFDSFMRRLTVGHIYGRHCVLAWAGSALAGASLNDLDDSQPRAANERPAWIRQLFVRPAWRGRGLGRALLAAALTRAQQLGYAQIGLMVDAENQCGAPRLYHSAGFVEVARRFTFTAQLAATTAV